MRLKPSSCFSAPHPVPCGGPEEGQCLVLGPRPSSDISAFLLSFLFLATSSLLLHQLWRGGAPAAGAPLLFRREVISGTRDSSLLFKYALYKPNSLPPIEYLIRRVQSKMMNRLPWRIEKLQFVLKKSFKIHALVEYQRGFENWLMVWTVHQHEETLSVEWSYKCYSSITKQNVFNLLQSKP